jgi:hypothetical protein
MDGSQGARCRKNFSVHILLIEGEQEGERRGKNSGAWAGPGKETQTPEAAKKNLGYRPWENQIFLN